jgi:hypothetical protein
MLRVLGSKGERIPEGIMEEYVEDMKRRASTDLAQALYYDVVPTILDERGNVAWSEPRERGLAAWVSG